MTSATSGPSEGGPDDREAPTTTAPDEGAHRRSAASIWEGRPGSRRRRARAADDDDSHDHSQHKKSLPLWQEVILLLGLALVLAIVVKAFFVQAFFVPSVSMEPTFVKQDRILVEKWSYWSGDVERGDIVVFDDPGGWLGPAESQQPSNIAQRALEAFGLYPTGGHLVKRVIGVGGDEVRCCNAKGQVLVNGVALDETSYLMQGVRPSEQTFDVEVPDGSLWVMGDNRPQSGDSRLHIGSAGGGFVPVDGVVGKVWAIVWPPDRAEILDKPEIFDDPALDGS